MRPEMNALKSELRRKDEFIAMLGYEPRNPLSVLTTAARIFKIDGTTSTDTKRTAARGSRFSVRLPVQQPKAGPCTRS